MTEFEQIRHGYNDGQTIFRRQSVNVLLARIEELEKENAKINFLFEQESAAREQLDKVNTGLVDTIHDLDEKIAELENEKWESDL